MSKTGRTSGSSARTDSKSAKLGRRTFLKGMGAAAAVGGGFLPLDAALEQAIAQTGGANAAAAIKTFRSTCAMECLHCNLTAHVVDGRIVKVEGTKGFNTKPCLRGLSRAQWVNHPDRLKYPLKRVGAKGEGKFERISWDEALDTIVTKLNETKAKLGNKGLLWLAGSGNMSSITNATAGAFFDFAGGVTARAGTLCCSAVTAAMMPIVGLRYADTRDSIPESKYILCWGNNPAVTMQAYWRDYMKAKEAGAKLVAIDPRFNETAERADEWVSIVPGTDTALALGMLRVIIKEDLHDKAFLLTHTGAPFLVDAKGDLMLAEGKAGAYLVFDTKTKKPVAHDAAGIVPALTLAGVSEAAGVRTVFDLVAAEAEAWTPKKTEAETDVPAATVTRLARDYATKKPAMIIQNMSGAQRTEFGTYVAASQFYLALFTGNIGKPGAGVCDAGGVTQFMATKPPIQAPRPTAALGSIPVSKLGEYILADKPNPIGFLWAMTTSVLTQYPNTNAVKAAFKKVPFVVVVDNLMTSSALYADIVLPTCTIFEETSLMAGTRSHYVQLMEKAVEPPGEARSDMWIFTELAKRLGFGQAFDKPIESHIEACLAGTGVTLAQIKEGPVKTVPLPWVPFKDGKFRTPHGKAMLYVADWKAKGYSPVVRYYRPVESPKGSPQLAAKYPLMSVQRKLIRNIHASFNTLPAMSEAWGTKPSVIIHPDDARRRKIKSGDVTVVFNDRGEHRAVAVVTRRVKKGVVVLDNGWWEQQGGSSSHVTNDAVEPLGFGQSCNSTLVQVRGEA